MSLSGRGSGLAFAAGEVTITANTSTQLCRKQITLFSQPLLVHTLAKGNTGQLMYYDACSKLFKYFYAQHKPNKLLYDHGILCVNRVSLFTFRYAIGSIMKVDETARTNFT